MPLGYTSLSLEERTQIGLLKSQGLKAPAIAAQIGRSPSTIYRELSRNTGLGGDYRAAGAHSVARQRRRSARAPLRKLGTQLDTPLGRHVRHELGRCLSPEQIAGRLKHMHPDDATQRISHETIYSAIYLMPRGELRSEIIAALRQSHGKRLPRARGTSRQSNIANLVPLSERPAEADSREVPGHWEADFIKGKRNASAVGTAIERTSRLTLLARVDGCTAAHALAGFTRRFNGVIPELRRSFTYDRGSEMACHEQLSLNTRMPVFFCDPRSPWQRGSNENLNGLVRQFLPKGMDLSTVTHQQLAYIEAALNDRPRKILGFRTPREVYDELVQKHLDARTSNSENLALQA